MNFRKMKMIVTAMVMMITAATTSFAQMAPAPGGSSDISDSDIEQFVAIQKKTMPAQMEAQKKMVEAIQEEGMEPQRFQELFMAKQQGKLDDASPTEEEEKALTSAVATITEIQKDVQGKVQTEVEASGMDMMKYQQIVMKYQQDQEMRSKIDGMMQGQ